MQSSRNQSLKIVENRVVQIRLPCIEERRCSSSEELSSDDPSICPSDVKSLLLVNPDIFPHCLLWFLRCLALGWGFGYVHPHSWHRHKSSGASAARTWAGIAANAQPLSCAFWNPVCPNNCVQTQSKSRNPPKSIVCPRISTKTQCLESVNLDSTVTGILKVPVSHIELHPQPNATGDLSGRRWHSLVDLEDVWRWSNRFKSWSVIENFSTVERGLDFSTDGCQTVVQSTSMQDSPFQIKFNPPPCTWT